MDVVRDILDDKANNRTRAHALAHCGTAGMRHLLLLRIRRGRHIEEFNIILARK